MAHKVAVTLNVFAAEPLAKQLSDRLRETIEAGKIRSGEKLPSIRDTAKQLQVSTITVREAIDRLIEQGMVLARHGSGNYVCSTHTSTIADHQPLEELQFTQATYAAAEWNLENDFRWTEEAQHMTAAFNDSAFHPWWDVPLTYDFRVYQPANQSVAGLHWNRIVDRYAQTQLGKSSDTSCELQGNATVRRALSDWLNCTRRLQTTADQLFLVAGAQQARDLVARMLVQDNTAVVVEEPGSITNLLAYSSKGARLIHIAQDFDGIRTDLLKEVEDASVAHLLTTANFPSAASLTRERAEQIVSWAAANHVTLVEDAYGGGFVYEPDQVTSLLEVASTSRNQVDVIYIGSLSQLLNPALRLAFVVVPERFHNAFAASSWLADAAPSALSQHLLNDYISEGYFEQDVLRVVQAARTRRRALLEGLSQWSQELISFEPVKAGFHQTVWFNQTIDDLRVFETGLARGVGIVPMSAYFRQDFWIPGMSLSFTQMDEDKIATGLQRLLEVVQECTSTNRA